MEARKIIITGGATRIGAAIARKLSGPGKELIIHYNKSKLKAENLKKDLQKQGTIVYLVKGDLSKEKDIKRIIRFSKSKMKYFDCLINNASLFEKLIWSYRFLPNFVIAQIFLSESIFLHVCQFL